MYFRAAMARLKTELGSEGCVSLTLDAWSAENCCDFLGVTVHWLTANLDFRSRLLAFVSSDREQQSVQDPE
jgi:hypothetical protein